MKKTLAFIFAAVLALSCFSGALAREFVTIGTGGITGVYYPTGGAISRIVNQQEDKMVDVRVTVESTGGSAFNVNAIMSGDMQFGVVQSDRQYQAYNGLADWEGNPQENLRAVFSIPPESVTLVAAEDSGIASMEDLIGKIVSIGNHGSGFRQNAIDALTASGIDYETDITAQDLAAVEAAGALQDGKIDAFSTPLDIPTAPLKRRPRARAKPCLCPSPMWTRCWQSIPTTPRASSPSPTIPAPCPTKTYRPSALWQRS